MSDRSDNGGGAGAGLSGTEQAGPSVDEGAPRPLGVVIASAVDGFRTLFRKQIELAKLEATEAASTRAMSVGMMVAAAVLALFAVGFVAASGAAALALVMPTWAADLIVAAVFGIVTAVLVLVGRRVMRNAPTVERTRETMKEDARWARQQLAR